jgi:alanyl-tRNA synthetase
MTSSEIRQSFLDFFREKQHTIVPSSSLLPDAPNLLFTNAGMNQFVPIFLGQAPCPYQPARAADTQKCIRAGGKHNDLEDVGFDTYHHTFFEMLGNWSFGDYFKKEAIAWAWELVVDRWHFPPSRIYATIYSPGPGDPASLDREAHEHWSEIFIAAGLDPAVHVVHGNKKDNFWMMGDTGPCGPCSELHVDLTPGLRDLDIPRQIAGRNLVNQGDARCIEIWNLVFIQFNANPDGTFVDLPAKHVDTGMGFERVTSMIQGTKGFTDLSENVKISNYETDVFRPIFDELEKLTGKTYKSTLPKSAQNLSEDEKVDVAFRVIADHIRTLSFSIADGIQPSNEGRGYVLRRILRRAVRYGRNLGLKEPFLGKLVAVLGLTMGRIFPEVVAKADAVKKTLTQEEESFLRTLERGIDIFESIYSAKKKISGVAKAIQEIPKDSSDGMIKIAGLFRGSDQMPGDRELLKKCLSQAEWEFFSDGEKISRSVSPTTGWGLEEDVEKWKAAAVSASIELSLFSGETAFLLYDTYGFPLDLTELIARERGLSVAAAAFDRLMDEQKARGKAAQKKDIITVEGASEDTISPTIFYGYNELQSVALLVANEGGAIAVSETPFYAEMGGQVGDAGEIEIHGKTVAVTNTIKSASGKVYFHKIAEPVEAKVGERVTLRVDENRRASIEAHHSGTHLLNWALRKVLGNTITQKGSYVGPDRLRFDFSHGAAVTSAELTEIEKLVNEKIEADVPVKWKERPYTDVKGDASILQFFGDKYGDVVRVVSIGDFSNELCGGTHVRSSGKVGYLKILSEGAIAAGIRRIEAASDVALVTYIHDHLPKQDADYELLRVRKADLAAFPAFTGEPSPQAFWKHWEARDAFLKQAAADVAQHEKEESKRKEAAFQKLAANEAAEMIIESPRIGEIPFIVHLVDYQPAAYLPVLADAIKKHWQGVVVLAAIEPGKVALLCSVAPAFTKKVQAGKIIQAMAPLVNGKGGGRPDLAQGGGTNPDGITAALEKAEEILQAIT